MQNIIDNLAVQIKDAAANHKTLAIRGGGSKSFYGEPIAENLEFIDTKAYSGVISYEPSELVLTARCGTPLAEVEDLLAQHDQMLAFEPPRFGAGTFGGCLASGLSGPRRMQVGPLSDFVLGTSLLNASGEVLKFGGEVMKNVAGYDLSRLLAGSLGSLGMVLDISIKVLPIPYTEKTTVLQLNEVDALTKCLSWHALPLPISATCWFSDDDGNGFLQVRLSGNDSAVSQALDFIGGESMADSQAQAFWLSIRDQKHGFFSEQPLWRISLPIGSVPLGLGPNLQEHNGCVRWLAGFYDADILRTQIKQLGGSACLFKRGGLAKQITTFDKLANPIMRIHQRLKHQFDPLGVFDIQRLLGQDWDKNHAD